MTTRNRLRGVVILVLALYASVALAGDQQIRPSAACSQADISQPSSVLFDLNGGAQNHFTGERVRIECGVGQDRALDTNDFVNLYYQDTSSQDGFTCASRSVNEDFSSAFIPPEKNSCATDGGCNSPSPAYTGYNHITFPIWHGGSYSTNISCHIPRRSTLVGEAWSTLRTIAIDAK